MSAQAAGRFATCRSMTQGDGMSVDAQTAVLRPAGTGEGAATTHATRYAWYVVVVLMACYTLSFIDRQILSLLVAPMKADLGISDTRVGLLQGFAFALFYTLLGLPMGWLADRHSRRNIIAIGIVTWSAMTALCSGARGFWSLFGARIGVGVGEASLAPSAFSLIADYMPRHRLSTALSIYSMGLFIGIGFALIVGGAVVAAVTAQPRVDVPLLGAMASWRVTFLVIGLPGVLFALWVLTLREPARKDVLRDSDGTVSRLTIREVFGQVSLKWQSIVGFGLGMAFIATVNYAFSAWAPTFFQRVYGWGPGRAGFLLGLITVGAGCIGVYCGGKMTDHWQARGVREAGLRTAIVSAIGCAICYPLALSAGSPVGTLILLAPALFFSAAPTGASYAAMQLIVPNQIRGQVGALFVVVLNVVALGLGPLVPGLLTDFVFKDEQRVGSSMLWTIGVASCLAALILASTVRHYRRHHAAMHPA
jgi:MFS family permease